MDVEPASSKRSGDFEANEACADDNGGLGRACARDDRFAVGEGAEIKDLRRVGAFDGDLDGIGAGGEQEGIVGIGLAAIGAKGLGLCVEGGDAGAEQQLDVAVAVPVRGAKGDPVVGCAAGEEVFGEIWTIHGRSAVGGDHRERAGVAFAAKHLGSGESGGASANDDDGGRLRGGGRWTLRRKLLSDEDRVAATFNLPARDGIEGRRMQGLAAAQTETGMMPWATYLVVDDKAVGERSVIVRAMSAHGEEVGTATDEQDIVTGDGALKFCTIRNAGDRNALGEIGLFRRIHTHPTPWATFYLVRREQVGKQRSGSHEEIGVSSSDMTLVILLRGVNVGGHRRFRPSVLAEQLRKYDIVSLGATGTFVVRKPGAKAKFCAELMRRLPVDATVAICDGRELLRAMQNPFGEQDAAIGVVRFVSVLVKESRVRPSLPIQLPPEGEWLVRVLGAKGRYVFGEYRRHMKTIGYLGQIDKIFGAKATTRNWTTMMKIVEMLKTQQHSSNLM